MINKAKQFKIHHKKLILNKQSRSHNKSCKDIQQQKIKNKRTSLYQKNQLQIKQYKRISISNNSLQKYKDNLINKSSQNTKQCIQQQIKLKLISLNKPLQSLLFNLINKIKQQQLLFTQNINDYTIQKNYFINIIQYLITNIINNNNSTHKLFRKLSSIQSNIHHLTEYIQQQILKQKHKHLSLSYNINQSIQQFHLSNQITQNIILLQNYIQTSNNIKIKIKHLQYDQICKQKQYQQLNYKIRNLQNMMHQIKSNISQLQIKQQNIAINIQQKQIILDQLNQQIHKIESYGPQNRYMINIINKQYKQIQSDLSQYANSLQSNKITSNQPQHEIQSTLINNYHQIILHSSIKSKIDSIIDFYQDQYKQVTNVCRLQQKYINEFINKMSKWLNTWGIKKQILINLRSHFCILHQNISTQFMQILHKIEQNKEMQSIKQRIKRIKMIYQQIQQNYKLGNSFY